MMTSSLFAADLCPDCQTEMVIDDQTGGLATSVPPHKLGKSYSPNLRNFNIDDNKLEQIKGFDVAGTTGVLQRVDGIYPYYFDDGQAYFLVTDSSMVLETSDFQTYVFVSSGLNVGAKVRCKQVNNDMICSNGVDAVFKWDHTSKTILDGNNGTPNVPRGKYIEFYQERVWMFNLPSDASGVRYSDVSSTNGVIINYDNFLAWPADNLLHVGQGDGQIGTAVWQENGQLKFGKERTIYTLFGNGLVGSQYIPRISNPGVGVASHDSVTILDNQSHFVGHDGIYRGEQRISDLIENESDLIDRSGIKTISNLWESQADFAKGQFSGTTATVEGLIMVQTGDFYMNFSTYSSPSSFPENQFLELSSTGSLSLDFASRISTNAIPSNFYGYFHSVPIMDRDFGSGSVTGLTLTVRNLRTGQSSAYTRTDGGGANFSLNTFTQEQTPSPSLTFFTADDLTTGKLQIKMEATFGGTAHYHYYSSTYTGFANVLLRSSTTGQFISEVSTLTTNTAWGNFESERNTNGGTINYYFRSSTSVINITTQAWQGVSAGSRIDAPTTNNFFQWASTIQTMNDTNIDNVEIVHIEGGGVVNRAFAIPWRGRYWLSFSTSADTISSAMLIKSKITNKNPDAWMPVSGINIRSFAKDKENILYGGSSSTGAVYRLDFGNNFNGSPIISEYETPSIYFDSLFKNKQLFEYYVTADRRPGSTYSLGVAIDTQAYTTTSYSLSGNGLQNRVIQNVRGHGKLFKWKITHSAYDEPFTFHNLGVTYKPALIRKGNDD